MIITYENAINYLQSFLINSNVDLINQTIRGSSYFVNPIPQYNAMLNYCNQLDLNEKTIVEFFLLGRKVKKEAIDKLDNNLLAALEILEIIKSKDDFVQLDELILITYMACFFFTSTPCAFPQNTSGNMNVYIGIDTYQLLNNQLNHKCNSILDICTGNGIQLIMACKRTSAKKGLGIDISDKSVEIAKLNCSINDMDDVITIIKGDIYSPINNDKFDLIYSNPPYIAVPIDINYPVYGNGGSTGLEIISRILSELSDYLSEKGQAVIYGETLGSDNRWFISDYIDEYLYNDFSTNLIIINHADVATHAKRISKIASNYNKLHSTSLKQWTDQYESIKATNHGCFILKIVKDNSNIFSHKVTTL
ncbi:MAG: class I SAM-dependent methyltransferase [Lachnospiraceae bacterium]|nr:class I SAM-dependent methyltransferase [Lachnospiraceae bacterium]